MVPHTGKTPIMGHHQERKKCPLSKRVPSLILTDTKLTRASFFKQGRNICSSNRGVARERFRSCCLEIFALAANLLFSFYPLCSWSPSFRHQSFLTRNFKVWSSMQKQEQMQQALRYNNAVRYPVLLYQTFFFVVVVCCC